MTSDTDFSLIFFAFRLFLFFFIIQMKKTDVNFGSVT